VLQGSITMECSSIVTGVAALIYIYIERELALNRVAAILAALVAVFHLSLLSGRRCWRQTHLGDPEAVFPPDRYSLLFLGSFPCETLLVTVPTYQGKCRDSSFMISYFSAWGNKRCEHCPFMFVQLQRADERGGSGDDIPLLYSWSPPPPMPPPPRG